MAEELTRTEHAGDVFAAPEASPTFENMSRRERAELEALRMEIAAERKEAQSTLEALQAQLTPAHLKAQAQEKVHDATVGKAQDMAHAAGHKTKEMGSSAWDTLKENWMPTVLIGAGAAWLVKSQMGGNGRGRDVYYDPYFDDEFPDDQLRHYAGPSADMHQHYVEGAERRGENGSRVEQLRKKAYGAASHAGDKAGDIVEEAKEKVGSAGEQAGSMVQDARKRATKSADRIGHEVRRMKEENPLIMAGVLFGIGAALGFLIPETRKEDEWMGETRDEWMEEAKSRGKETLEQAQEVAKETGKTAVETAKKEAQDKGLTSESSVFEETRTGTHKF